MILGTNTSVAQGDADNFYKSNSVNTEKVSFSNQYKMKVGARLFLPKELEEGRKYPAVIVGHPMGAVKEQSAGLYATKLAECGFVTLALDLSFWGESDGEPRNAVLAGCLFGGLQRSGGFPRHPPLCRPGTYRRCRDLRQRSFAISSCEDPTPA